MYTAQSPSASHVGRHRFPPDVGTYVQAVPTAQFTCALQGAVQ